MIGDVRRKVSLYAVVAHDHAVFVIAEGGGPKPQRAVFFVHMIVLCQLVQRAVDGTVVGQRALRIPAVKRHAEFAQILFDVGQDGGQTQIEHFAKACFTDQ